MAIGRDGAVLREFRALYESGTIGGLTDGQLLERFATGRGEVAERAFAMLVERHGPMVLRVCRGVLVDPNDAQDAFQATFLVLLRKSRGLWVRDSLGPWLHQVALRTASCARSVASRRKRHEHRAAELAASEQSRGHVEKGRDWEPVLHQEIERLPERYRVTVVLCDLEGQSHAQAARQLGWPVGTVKSRLSRARDRLRSRLIRRGLAPAAGLAAVLASESTRAAVPTVLARSTTALATNLTAAGVVPASVAGLAKGALKTMMLAKFRVLAIALPAIVAAAGAGIFARGDGPAPSPNPENPPAAPSPESSPAQAENVAVFEATTGPLNFTVVERGTLEATRSSDLISEIEGSTTILSLVPEGTRVKKGDLVCELDSSVLRELLVDHRIANARAKAAYENAKRTREVAEIARTEYAEGIYKEERNAREGAIVEAKLAVRQTEDRLQRTRHAHQQIEAIQADRKGALTPSDILAVLEIADRLDAAEQTAQREKMALEQAELKLESLEKYTRARRDRELEVEIARAKADELAKQQSFELATSRLENLRKQIEKTKLYAPTDGRIVYADVLPRSNRQRIEEGAVVHERQRILSIVDLDAPMRVNAKVRELWVDQIKPRQKVRIRVDAFPDQTFSGAVETVAPLPDPITLSAQKRKVYSTRIRIEDSLPSLRPGMTAEVRILVGERDQVVRVPVQAIVRFHGQDRVAVKTREGDFAWRVVTLGLANEEIVEVREGLQDGDLVAADPAALMTEEERQARFRKPARRARPAIEK